MNSSSLDIFCWICNNSTIPLDNFDGVNLENLSPEMFRITDFNYGKSLPRYKCSECGFIQCHDAGNLIKYYELMDDEEYENGTKARTKQALNLIRKVGITKKASWLDVGCGAGILVGAAKSLGIDAVGVEPSLTLASAGISQGLDIRHGTLDKNFFTANSFDVVSLIDVIEHVEDPKKLVSQCVNLLKPQGMLLISTPDANSFLARALKSRWWHVRVAHVGYFNKNNLSSVLESNGVVSLKWFRPIWYFEFGYLYKRICSLFKFLPQLDTDSKIPSFIIPLNLLDSWAVVGKVDKK